MEALGAVPKVGPDVARRWKMDVENWVRGEKVRPGIEVK